jgi:hypothetical protein
VFSMRSAPSKSTIIYRKFVARQSSAKHASTTMGDDVFSAVCAKALSYKQTELHFRSSTHVEAGSNPSTVTLRVVGGDENEVSNLRQ